MSSNRIRLSVIVPTLNEASGIEGCLESLQGLRGRGHEVILVDGESSDDTLPLAMPLVDRLMTSPRGRARQMNAGAGVARGDVLVFLHADTQLPEAADTLIREGLASGASWGRFDVTLCGDHPMLPVIAVCMNWRSRLTGIATGDQAMFVRRDVFAVVEGFREMDLMEDVELSARLRKIGAPVCLRESVSTSARRWTTHGVARTIFTMWRLRLAFALGSDPARLNEIYNKV